MEVFQIILSSLLTRAEMVSIFALFTSIRFNITLGAFMVAIITFIGTICFIFIKLGIEYASNFTDASRDFGKLPCIVGPNTRLKKVDTIFRRSCRPLVTVVGSTFTITRNTFQSISQDVIFSGLINLLLTFWMHVGNSNQTALCFSLSDKLFCLFVIALVRLMSI